MSTYLFLKHIYLGEIEKNLQQNIASFCVDLKNLHEIKNKALGLKKVLNLRISIIDESGVVIAESDKDEKLLENHLQRLEIQEAKKNGFGKSLRHSKTLNKKLLYVAKKISINGKVYYVRMADYVSKISKDFLLLWVQILLLFCIFLALAFFFAYKLSIKIQKQTNDILDFLSKLSRGKNKQKIQSNFSLEFYQITNKLNKVAEQKAQTDRKKNKQRAKLKLANRQKDAIISALSHEFKNPITIILGYIQTILSEEEMPKDLRNSFLLKIQNSSQKMFFLIDRLRLAVRLENPNQKLILEPCFLHEIIEDLVFELKQSFKGRKILINAQKINLKVDKYLFYIAVYNLVENALKYSQDEVLISLDENSLSVKDNGLGMDEKEIKKIKNKFYRIEDNKWNNSLGLGLFIVNSIIKLHGFSLKINSKKSHGSEFRIIF